MIDISEVANGVLVSAIGATGKWLATASRAPRGRKAEDLSIARWFETFSLTSHPPELSDLAPSDAELTADALRGPDVQGTLQELLSARLTNAPEADAIRAREAFCLTLTRTVPVASSFASELADYYDEQISELVARLQASGPALLAQIRSEALSSRMIAVLNAIERHSAALESVPRDADTFLSNYRRQVIDHHGKLQPPDFDRRRRVPIDDIYVSAVIYEEASAEQDSVTAEPPPSLTIWELATRADRSVLLGDPGGGKTTASNVLMHHFASDASSHVPFLVTLRDFASEDPPSQSIVGHIEHLLETFYQCPAPPGLVDALLLTGRAIVFFDGLDELLDPARRAGVAERVERFCTEYPLAPVLVTSRVVGYDQARLDDRQFTCYRLGGFSDEDVTNYAHKWFALEDGYKPEAAETFLTESESVPDLRTNPLLLSLMCILYRGEGSLPQSRAKVYEECANLLFRKWDARRKIHADLRVAHLVEPSLRHLAWWLFTRSDTQAAVTERELVDTATEFLHGRGFEAVDDAREAAREFIEFCRGRMWVFTDTGTTSAGEALYSFTHRTFLEYFAAAQLAFDSDTPERLARTLAPHIARGEWEVVGELSVQIKDSTSVDGAHRIYEKLLADRRYHSPESRSGILRFLARTLRSVNPTPPTIQRLTREAVEFLFAGDPHSKTRGLPLAWLLGSCGSCLPVVDKAVADSIWTMVNSSKSHMHVNGLMLAIALHIPLTVNWDGAGPELPKNNQLSLHWSTQARNNAITYKAEITTASANHPKLRRIALTRQVINVTQALQPEGGLLMLLRKQDDGLFNSIHFGYLHESFFSLSIQWPHLPSYAISRHIQDFVEMGYHIVRYPQPPWIPSISDSWHFPLRGERIRPRTGEAPPAVTPAAYLGAAVTLLIAIESTPAMEGDLQGFNSSRLGLFQELYPYIVHRYVSNSRSLPDLPVPYEFKQVFRDWADNKVNFVGDSPDQ